MSQVETLLASLTGTVSDHIHPVVDSDSYFIIDHVTRRIDNTAYRKNTIMQYDHNSERFTFEIARYVEGHDMSLCNRVRVHYINVGIDDETQETISNADLAELDDLQVDPNNPEKVICSWLISRHATQLAGTLSFLVQYMCISDMGVVDYEWHSGIYDDIDVDAGRNNGETAIIEHTDLVEQWRAKLFDSGDSVISEITLNAETQLSNIRTEGASQVAAVTAEGEAQVAAVTNTGKEEIAAIELKGLQTLESIPEDYTETNNMADEAVRTKSNAIVCESAGENIVVKDSSNDYIRGLKVFGKSIQVTTTGKNLFNCVETHFPRTLSGVTFTYSDGWVILNGTCTDSTNLKLGTIELSDGSYTLSANNSSNNNINQALVQVYSYSAGKGLAATDNKNDSYSVGVLNSGTYECRIRIETGITYTNFMVRPQLEIGSIATEYEPYTGGKPSPNPDYPQEIVSVENPTANVCGKNLLELTASTDTVCGVTFAINDDGTVAVNGTATESILFDISYRPSGIKANTKYFLCGCPSGGGDARYYLRVSDRLTQAHDDYGSGIKFKYSNVSNLTVSIRVMAGVTVSNLVFKPMVCAVNVTDHAFESYKPIQSIDITHTLPGIPVTSGGNYTDSDGQQWICDEIDLERGMYVQRLNTLVLDGSSDETWGRNDVTPFVRFVLNRSDIKYGSGRTPFVCSHFSSKDITSDRIGLCFVGTTAPGQLYFYPKEGLDSWEKWCGWLSENPITVRYVLATPIETPLTGDEIAAFKSLRTNCPNTTILNDAGAWMSVKYNADTKTYVENPKTLKLVDSSTGVVYELKIIDGNLTVVPV